MNSSGENSNSSENKSVCADKGVLSKAFKASSYNTLSCATC